jgi:hypothetical protein
MKLFHNKKVVDEREQMEMFRVEHYMYWLAFWALLAGIFYQVIFMDASFGQVAGEWTVFMLMAVGLVIGDLAGGHFDYNGRPGWKYYLVSSLTAAAAVVGITLVNGIRHGWYESVSDVVIPVGTLGALTFLFTYTAVAAAGAFVKYRRRKLEKEYEDDR